MKKDIKISEKGLKIGKIILYVWVILIAISALISKELFSLLATPFILVVFSIFMIGYLRDTADKKEDNNEDKK